jgi:hypothetical protein
MADGQREIADFLVMKAGHRPEVSCSNYTLFGTTF